MHTRLIDPIVGSICGPVPFQGSSESPDHEKETMTTLSELTAKFQPATTISVPERWTQGRTAYGGLTAALSVQATQMSEDAELPALASAQFAFTAPVIAEVDLTARRLRRGRSATSMAVQATSQGHVSAQATLVFARSRDSSIDHDLLACPEVPDPHDCPQFAEPSPLRPAFVDNFDMRRAGGDTPLAQAVSPSFVAWSRHRDAHGVDPTVALVALADCLPPAAMGSFVEWAPISTMTWSIHLCADEPPAPDGWFLLQSRSTFTRHGYSHQDMTLWDADRRPVLTATQTVAVFA